ncbi:Hypothetical protein PHPALM_17816 [Phytophthora palmivora]|uniref:Pol protein n=1 Tax=Phytophthora palmivora TaxID=4796 RepID=A0A2P4XL93_9STRA|nr:Hypothetical protein PHPALM_17816 [Phytophthora palmivora]
MARWLSFFAEYNCCVEYKPGKLNVLADSLSRRPDYELAHVSWVTTDLYDRIRLADQEDENYTPLVQVLFGGKDAKVDRLSPRQRAQLHRYELADGLLHYSVKPEDSPGIVVPNDEDLKYDILLEAHDAPMSGTMDGRRSIRQPLRHSGGPACTSGWHTMSRHVKHVLTVKPSDHASAPLQSLPIPANCWKSMILDFAFGLPADDKENTGILVFFCRLSKMVHLALLFLDSVFRYHGLPEIIASDRDPRFTGAFWDTLFQLLGTKLTMSTACSKIPFAVSVLRLLGPGQTSFLWLSLHSTMPYTHYGVYPVLLEWVTTPPGTDASIVGGGEARKAFSSQVSETVRIFKKTIVVVYRRQADVDQPVSSVESNKLKHRFVGPFAVLARHDTAYTIDL